jgi:sugar fermentation stimulation protein A
MKFSTPLIEGRLLRRYKRFLADVELADGEIITAHCPNPGAMLGVAVPGSRVFLTPAAPKAKLRYGWELAEVDGGLIGINTNRPNQIIRDALARGQIPALADFAPFRAEVGYGTNSRVDFLGEAQGRSCFVEVKNVHLSRQRGLAEFPDCVTARGAKHLEELALQVAKGHRAVMVYLIQRMDCHRLCLAADLDPIYARTFGRVQCLGVEALAYSCMIDQTGIELGPMVPMIASA